MWLNFLANLKNVFGPVDLLEKLPNDYACAWWIIMQLFLMDRLGYDIVSFLHSGRACDLN